MSGNFIENLPTSKSNNLKAQHLPTPSKVLIRCPLPSDGIKGVGPRSRMKVTLADLLSQHGKDVDSRVSSEGRGRVVDHPWIGEYDNNEEIPDSYTFSHEMRGNV